MANLAEDILPDPEKNSRLLRDYQYKRLGTVSILAALDLHDGHVFTQVHDRHRSKEFICLLQELDSYYPQQCQIRIVLDNHSAHISKETRAYLATRPNRFIYVHTPTYHLAMMLKILFYAYTKGIFSSRKIADAVKENVGFIFLAAWQKPDFRTISDFRKNNFKELGLLFAQVVQLCRQMDMVKLYHVSIDGTKIKAKASDKKTYDSKRVDREIARWLELTEAADQQEDQCYGKDQAGDELPEDIRNQQQRIQRLNELKEKLDSETGRAIYGQRKYTVEPPFGHIKSIMGFTSFSLRGIPNVKGEFKLVSIAHNLRKIWLYLKASGKSLAEMCPALGN